MSKSLRDKPIDLKSKTLKSGPKQKCVEFSDLDDDAIGMIVDKLKLKERLAFRKVSRRLRTLVDQKRSILETLSISCETDHVCITYNGRGVIYGNPKRFRNPFMIDFENEKVVKVVRSKDYPKMALNDLQSVIKDPTVQLKELNVECLFNNFSGKLKNILKSLDHKISTKYLKISVVETCQILDILPYLKPGTLECINIKEVILALTKSGMDQIANSEQWKQAKEISLKNDSNMWPEQYLMHFKRFSFFEVTTTVEDILKWRDFFSKSPNFELCRFVTELRIAPHNIQDHLGDVISSQVVGRHPVYTFHHPMMTDLNQVLEIKVGLRTGVYSFTKIARPL